MSNCRDLQWKGDGSVGVPTYWKPITRSVVSKVTCNPLIIINKKTQGSPMAPNSRSNKPDKVEVKGSTATCGCNYNSIKIFCIIIILIFLLQRIFRK